LNAFTAGNDHLAVRVFFCKVHIMRALRKNISSTAVIQGLMSAIHANTKNGCATRLRQAHDMANDNVKKYLNRMFSLDSSASWAMYARNHSCLLLQSLTTNNVENYHSQIKSGRRGIALGKKNGMMAVVDTATKVDNGRLASAATAALKFRTRNLSLCNLYPKLATFPHPVQVLINEQFTAATEKFEEGQTPTEDMASPHCGCTFYRKYFLPCRHIFLMDLAVGSFLTDERWEEGGFEHYFQRTTEYVQVQEAPVPRHVAYHETQEELKEGYYAFCTDPVKGPVVDRLMTELREKLRAMHLGSIPGPDQQVSNCAQCISCGEQSNVVVVGPGTRKRTRVTSKKPR